MKNTNILPVSTPYATGGACKARRIKGAIAKNIILGIKALLGCKDNFALQCGHCLASEIAGSIFEKDNSL